MRRVASAVVVAIVLLSLAACNKDVQWRHCVDGECLNLADFAAGIEQRLDGQVVGYQLSVTYDGLVVHQSGNGLSRTSTDSPSTPMTADMRMNIASVNKTLTAVAVLRTLASRGVGLDDTIAPYLPDAWTPGPGVGTITFRELLTHTSGLECHQAVVYDESYSGLQMMVQQGLVPLGSAWDKSACYENGNFALFRIILPYVEKLHATSTSVSEDTLSADYLKILNDEVIKPSGITAAAGCAPSNQAGHVLFYPYPPGTAKGTDFGDWTRTCGGGGLHLSSADLALFLDRLTRTSDLLSTDQRRAMYDGMLGWQRDWSNRVVKHGTYHSHGGYLPSAVVQGATVQACAPGSLAEDNALIMTFSIGVQVVLLINSKVGNLNCQPALQDTVAAAYDESWTPSNAA